MSTEEGKKGGQTENLQYQLLSILTNDSEAQGKEKTLLRSRIITSNLLLLCVIQEGFSEELTHPVSRDQQKKECPERMCTGKDPKWGKFQLCWANGKKVSSEWLQGWSQMNRGTSLVLLLLQADWLWRNMAERPLTTILSNLDSKARCGHRASFSSPGHATGAWSPKSGQLLGGRFLAGCPGQTGWAWLKPAGPCHGAVNPPSDERCLMARNVFKMQPRCRTLFYMQYH